MKKFIYIFVLLVTSCVSAQEDLDFDFDYAQFGYDSVSNYVEFYYTFNQNDLSLNISDSINSVEGILKISVKDSANGDFVVNNEWKVSHQVTDTSDSWKNIVGAIGFVIPEGTFDLIVGGIDSRDSAHKKIIDEKLRVKPLYGDEIAISDIQLASKIIQDSPNKNSVFYKNTFEVVPVSSNIFGENQPVVFYYSEVYNLLDASGNNLTLKSLVFDSKGNIVSSKTKPLSKDIDSRVEVGTVVVNKWPTDTYVLLEAVVDSATNYGVSSSKKFFVYNPSVKVSDTTHGSSISTLGSEFSVMTEDELDRIFQQSEYIASSGEIDQYEKLNTIEGKKEFLFEFWKNRDPDPSTVRNEGYNEYMRRVRHTNTQFGGITREGWKTDRGRVFLMYGEPSEIERFPNQVDTKPYEIWRYNELEGGVIFVFADITGFSQYLLVHSTLRGELQDYDWARRISTGY